MIKFEIVYWPFLFNQQTLDFNCLSFLANGLLVENKMSKYIYCQYLRSTNNTKLIARISFFVRLENVPLFKDANTNTPNANLHTIKMTNDY